jgi:hypothetical protein
VVLMAHANRKQTRCPKCNSSRPFVRTVNTPDGVSYTVRGCCSLYAHRATTSMVHKVPRILRSLTSRHLTFAKIEDALGWPSGTIRRLKVQGWTSPEASCLGRFAAENGVTC